MDRLKRSTPAVLAALAVWLVPPLVVQDTFVMHLLVLSAIFAIVVTGLNLVMGYSGLLSLGHHAFFGLGAYASALTVGAGLPMVVGLAAAALAGAVASRLVGAILLKLRAAFFVIATIAFAEILRIVALNWVDVTQGPMGITGVRPLSLPLPGASVPLATPQRAYLLVAAFAIVAVVLVGRIIASPMGVGLVAMRESEYLARSIGIDTARLALHSVVIGSAIAGVGGGLYAHYVQFVSPDVLSFTLMITLVIMVLGGGMGTLFGPVLGALIFTLVPEFLRASDEYRLIVYGLVIVLLVRYLPTGVWGLGRRLAALGGARRLAPDAAARRTAPRRAAVLNAQAQAEPAAVVETGPEEQERVRDAGRTLS